MMSHRFLNGHDHSWDVDTSSHPSNEVDLALHIPRVGEVFFEAGVVLVAALAVAFIGGLFA